MAIKFVRSVKPRDLDMGANDTRSCARGGHDCRLPMSWQQPYPMREYELSSGERVLVCRRACAEELERVVLGHGLTPGR